MHKGYRAIRISEVLLMPCEHIASPSDFVECDGDTSAAALVRSTTKGNPVGNYALSNPDASGQNTRARALISPGSPVVKSWTLRAGAGPSRYRGCRCR